MTLRIILAVLLCSVIPAYSAGLTKVTDLLRITNPPPRLLFMVVTGDLATVSHAIEVTNLLEYLVSQPNWPEGNGGGEPSNGDKGDITVSGGGAWTIDANVVTDAKLASGGIKDRAVTNAEPTTFGIVNQTLNARISSSENDVGFYHRFRGPETNAVGLRALATDSGHSFRLHSQATAPAGAEVGTNGLLLTSTGLVLNATSAASVYYTVSNAVSEFGQKWNRHWAHFRWYSTTNATGGDTIGLHNFNNAIIGTLSGNLFHTGIDYSGRVTVERDIVDSGFHEVFIDSTPLPNVGPDGDGPSEVMISWGVRGNYLNFSVNQFTTNIYRVGGWPFATNAVPTFQLGGSSTNKWKILLKAVGSAYAGPEHTIWNHAGNLRVDDSNFDGNLISTAPTLQAIADAVDDLALGGGAGTVTSVAASSSTLSISGSPITTSGTLVLNVDTNTIKGLTETGTPNTNTTIMGQNPLTASLVEIALANLPISGLVQAALDLKQTLDSDLTTWAGITPSANVQSLVGAANYAAIRALLDLEAGTDFLGYPTGTPTGSKFLRDDNSWQTIAGGGDALVANPLSQFAATTAAQLASVLTGETGTGSPVFSNAPVVFAADFIGTSQFLAPIEATSAVFSAPVTNNDAAYFNSNVTQSSGNTAALGTLTADSASSIIGYGPATTRPLRQYGTNLFFDIGNLSVGGYSWSNNLVSGSGLATNINIIGTNMPVGYVADIWLTLGPGVTPMFPGIADTNWGGGRVPSFATNFTTVRVQVINRGGGITNAYVVQQELILAKGPGIDATTNFLTGVVTFHLAPALTNLMGTVANNVTNENSSQLTITTGTLDLTSGSVLANLVGTVGNNVTNVVSGWGIHSLLSAGTLTTTLTNRSAGTATNAFTLVADFSDTANKQIYNVTAFSTNALTIATTNLVVGRTVCVSMGTNMLTYNVTVLDMAGAPVQWNFNVATNGATAFTKTNSMAAKLFLTAETNGVLTADFGFYRR